MTIGARPERNHHIRRIFPQIVSAVAPKIQEGDADAVQANGNRRWGPMTRTPPSFVIGPTVYLLETPKAHSVKTR